MRALIALDPVRHVLGSLCRAGHDWNGTGRSARFRHNGLCIVCKRESYHRTMKDPARRERQRKIWRAADQRRPAGARSRYSMAHRKRRLATDPYFALVDRLRGRVRRALGRKSKRSRDLGIDYAAIAAHLGPCPGDVKEWHVDHVRALSFYNLRDPEQVRAAFAPTNHQWLPAVENIRKGGRNRVRQAA